MAFSVKETYNYNCHFCNRKYKLKENYDKHFVTCEYLHQMKMKSHDEIVDSMEAVPNNRELFNLIKTVLLKNNVLENEVKRLKNIVNVRHKKEVLEYLNQNKIKNMNTFMEWYKSSAITEDDLKIALDSDLTKAIEFVIKKIIMTTDLKQPICWFKEKPNQLFIYDYDGTGSQNKSWRIALHQDIEKMVVFISHALLKIFVNWQKENREFFTESDKNKDLEILYMTRISGIKNPVEKRTAEIKKWLSGFSTICKSDCLIME